MTNIYDKVICIIDTDVCGKSELGCFCDNLNILKTISAGNIGLMVQHYNFEDELRKISQENDLGKLVGAKHSHTTEIKSILAQKVDYNKLYKSFKIHEYCDFGNKFEGVLHEYGLSLPKKVEFITLKK